MKSEHNPQPVGAYDAYKAELEQLRQKAWKKNLIIIWIMVPLALLSGVVVWLDVSSDFSNKYASVIIVTLMPILFILYSLFDNNDTRTEEKVERLHIRESLNPTQVLTAALQEATLSDDEKTTTEEEYFNRLLSINIENLSSYYIQVRQHAAKSFFASIAMALLGFSLIVIALAVGFNGTDSNHIMAYITSGSGVIVEFISAVFFYLYRQTVAQMKEYHDSLLAVQNTLLSLRLVGNIREEKLRYEATLEVVRYLLAHHNQPLK